MPLLRDPVAVMGCLDAEEGNVVDSFLDLFKERFNLASAGRQAIEALLDQGLLESQAKSAELGLVPIEVLGHRAFKRARTEPPRAEPPAESDWLAALAVVSRRKPRRFGSRLRLATSVAPDARARLERAERDPWVAALAGLLMGSGTPAEEHSRSSPTAHQRFAAGRRVGTLRARVQILQAYRTWDSEVFGAVFPRERAHITEYLELRHSEGVSRSKMRGIFSSLTFFEVVAGLPTPERLTEDQVVKNSYKELLTLATVGAPPRSAPRPLLVMLAGLGRYILNVG